MQCINFAINPSQMKFCFAECQILFRSSTVWYQRRVDNIFLTIDYNKRKHRKQVKDVMHGSLQRRYNVIQCTDFVIFHWEVIDLCGTSHFDRKNGRVWRLVLRLGLEHCSCHVPHVRQQGVHNIFLTVRLAHPEDKKKKVKGVFDDKLQSRNNVVECIYYLSFGSPAIMPNVKFLVSSTTWHH